MTDRTRSQHGLRRSAVAAAASALLVAGCQSYQPVPLTRDAVDAALQTPELIGLNEAYKPREHQSLPAITIDPADGIEPMEAACIAVMLNPSLRSARSRRSIAAAQLIQAGLLPNPQLNASIDIPFGGATDGTVNAYGLGISWDITALIEQRASIDAARASDAAAALDLIWQEWQIAGAARLAATQAAWRNRAGRTLNRAVDEAAASAETILQARDAGEATDMDAAAANATLQAYTSRLRTAERDRDLAALQAKRAMGLGPDAEIAFKTADNGAFVDPPDLASAFAVARDSRVDLAALRYGYQAQEESVRAAILSQFPRISFGVNAARDTGDVQTIGVGISIDLPIFDRSQGRIANERATREVLYNEYIEREFALRADLAAALTELSRLEPAIAAQREYVQSTRHALDVANREEAADSVDVFAIQQLQTEAIDAELALVDLEQRRAELGVVLSTESGFPYGDDAR